MAGTGQHIPNPWDDVGVEKNPWSDIPTTTVKKKEPDFVPSSQNFGLPPQLVSGGQSTASDKQKILNYLQQSKTPEEKALAQPKALTQTSFKKNESPFDMVVNEESVKQGSQKINDIMLGEGDKWKDPVKHLEDQVKDAKDINELNNLNVAAALTRSSLAPDGFEAKRIYNTTDTWKGKEDTNQTAKLLKNKADEYDSKVQGIRDILSKKTEAYSGQSFLNLDLTDAAQDPKSLDLYKPMLDDAAVKYYANINPQFSKELKSLGIDPNEEGAASKIPSGKMGDIKARFLSDPDIAAFVQKEQPNLLPAFQRTQQTLLTDNKDYGINVVANEVSRARQQLGENGMIVGFYGDAQKKETNKIAEELYKDDPQKLKIYNDYIKHHQEDYIDAPSLLERFAGAGKRIFGGIANTVTEPFTSTKQSVLDQWEKEAHNVSADPHGLARFFANTGDVLGTVATLYGTAGIGGTSKLAMPVATGTAFFGDELENAKREFPDSPIKAYTSALVKTGMYAAMSSEIFPAGKVGQAFKKVSPEINDVIDNLANGTITREAARTQLTSSFGKLMNFAGSTLAKNTKITTELQGINLVSKTLDKILGADRQFTEPADTDELKSSFLSNLVLSGLAVKGEIKTKNELAENSIYEAATNPKRFERIIETNGENKDQLLSNLKYVSDLKTELDNLGIDPEKQKTFLYNALQEKVRKEQIVNQPESAVTRKAEKDIQEFQKAQDDILNKSKEEKIEEPIQPDNEKTETTQESIPVETKEEVTPTATPDETKPATTEGTPPKEPLKNGLPFGKQPTSGITHEAQGVRALDVNAGQPERGEGVTVEETIKHGNDLLSKGEDPDKAAKDFKESNKISYDSLSLVRAKQHQLEKVTNKAIDDFGENSKQANDARKEERDWYNTVVKPMQTEWHKIGVAQQGMVDIDTGSYSGLRRAVEKSTGRDITTEQSKIAKEHVKKINNLNDEVEKLKIQLTKAIHEYSSGAKEVKDKEPTISEKAKNLANRLREKAKLSKPGSFSAATPASVVWDGAVEVVAKTIEAGGKLADAIGKGIEHIRNSDWYKGLTKDEQKKAEDDFTVWHEDLKQESNINEKFANKTNNKFTSDEAKDIWDYAKENYLDKGADFDSMIQKTAMDLGLRPDQVRDAIITPKAAKKISDEMYKKQYLRNQAIQKAKDWATSSNQGALTKFLKSVPRFFFAVKVFGHGTVGMVTHAGINVYDPVEWKRYWPSWFKQFNFAYGKLGNYEKAMQDLKNDKDFIFWKRNGLAVDPTERYDEYQYITKMFQKMGRIGKWLTAGDRGFNALKVYRLERAKALWANTSDIEKADPNTGKQIAALVNHSTGTTGLKVSDIANTVFFAPNLELSRWNKLVADPAKAVKTFSNWSNASDAEKAAAKIVAARAGRILATYMGALAANGGLLSLSGSNQKINFFDPTSADWLKFKAGGRTIDATGGMVSLLRFITNIAGIAFSGQKQKDKLYTGIGDYAAGKLSPFAATAKDVVTHHDFQGNTLPFFNDKPLHSWNKKLSWGEYIGSSQTPIPVAEFFTDMNKQLEDAGVKKATAAQILQSFFVAATVGGAGVHIGEEPEPKTPLLNEQDKKDPTFKYFLDKGMELPNTSLNSEEITDEENKTKKKISDYPKDIQEKYQKEHKDLLKEELDKIKDNGVVYVKSYTDNSGEKKNEIYTEPPDGDYEETEISKLSKEDMAQILRIAQSKATRRAKENVFENK